jgi:hypothetical protein
MPAAGNPSQAGQNVGSILKPSSALSHVMNSRKLWRWRALRGKTKLCPT